MPLGSLTAKDADAAVAQFRRSTTERVIPPIPRFVTDAMKNTVHIFNVGPWEHKQRLGGYGEFVIPACPLSELFVEMTPCLTDPMTELYVKNEAEMGRFEEDGRQFANELLGLGRGQNSAYSLIHKGCFVAAGEKPTRDEIFAAKEELKAECMRLVNEARNLAQSNNPMAREAIVPEVHFKAAEVLNLTDEPWLLARNPEQRMKCPVCGTMAGLGVLKCATQGCGYIFDVPAYNKIMAEQKEQMESA